MQVFDWDRRIAPKGVAFNPRGMSVGGPPTLSGRTQVAAYDAGFWEATLGGINAGGPERVNAFRALRAKMAGGANAVRVPVFDRDQAPWPDASLIPSVIPFSGPTYFTGGIGFYERAIKVTLGADYLSRSSFITARVKVAGEIKAGQYFSVGDRLHQIREVVDDGGYAAANSSPSSEAAAIFAATGSLTWSPIRRAVVDRACNRAIATGVWGDLGLFYAMNMSEAGDATDAKARLNWKNPGVTGTLTAVGSALTATPDVGFIGDDTNALDTGIAENAIPGFAQDDAHAGVWVSTEVAVGLGSDRRALGVASGEGTRITPRTDATGATMATRINSTNTSSQTLSPATGVGHSVLSRASSAGYAAYRNGALLENETDTSAAPSSANARILGHGTTRFNATVAIAHWGAALTAQKVADLYAINREIVAGARDGILQSWVIWPPLREDVAAGTELDFDNPVCRMRLDGEASADLGLQYGRVGSPDAHFIEQF